MGGNEESFIYLFINVRQMQFLQIEFKRFLILFFNVDAKLNNK